MTEDERQAAGGSVGAPGTGAPGAGAPGAGAPGDGATAGSWDASAVRALRARLGLTQAELAERMGTRQQTVSEWETGVRAPRRMSRRLLRMVAEEAGVYDPGPPDVQTDTQPDPGPHAVARDGHSAS
ncbi:MAG: helix-turn-helix transcriptional regulator [Dehalococcoidia bacterium]